MVKKAPKQTKKEQKVEAKAMPIETLIKECDAGVIVTSKNGIIEVTAIKNISYAHEAKGLLVGALDQYTLRPIISALNNLSRNTLGYFDNAVKAIKEKA